MEAWFLREWQRHSPWQVLLRPLSCMYALLASARRACYRTGILRCSRVGVPVIIVGNITVGGTGKTPLVLAIVHCLAQSGRRCGIISRGYTRSANTDNRDPARVIQVGTGNAVSSPMSDVAQLLARRAGAPVYVARDRAAAARSLLHDHPDVDVLICDDGMQHYALHRDLEICVIDGARGFGNGALLPAGPMREPAARLKQVDAIVVNGTGGPGQLIIGQAAQPSRVFSMSLGNESLVRVCDDKAMSIAQGLAEFSTKRVVAVAGIGNPPRFFDHVAGLGFRPATTRSFPDHHPFSASDFKGHAAEIILMTEKDAVKCRGFADDRMWFMRVDAILPDAFGEFVIKRLSELKK